MRILAIYSLLLLLTGCASAWVIYQDEDEGAIGYQGPSAEENTRRVHALILQHCPQFRKVSDRLSSRPTTTVMPVSTYGTSYSSTGQMATYNGTSYVPVSTYDEYMIYKYQCIRTGNATSYDSPRKPEQECMQSCYNDSAWGRIPDSMSISECIAERCER